MKGKVVKFTCEHERFYWFGAIGTPDEKIDRMAKIGRIGYCRECWMEKEIVSSRDLNDKEQEELLRLKKMFDKYRKKN